MSPHEPCCHQVGNVAWRKVTWLQPAKRAIPALLNQRWTHRSEVKLQRSPTLGASVGFLEIQSGKGTGTMATTDSAVQWHSVGIRVSSHVAATTNTCGDKRVRAKASVQCPTNVTVFSSNGLKFWVNWRLSMNTNLAECKMHATGRSSSVCSACMMH